MRVLEATELGALPAQNARRTRLQRDAVFETRNKVAFAKQTRYPEAVNDIGRSELDFDVLTGRKVQLVSRDKAFTLAALIAYLPPPLSPRNGHKLSGGIVGKELLLPCKAKPSERQ